MLVYADIDEAIKTNSLFTSDSKADEIMIDRERRVLEMIKEEFLS